MLFLDTWFWIFAAVAIPVFWLCPRPLKLYWLLGASAVFQYHFAGPAGMAPIMVLAIVTYLTGLAISPAHGRRPFLWTVVLLVGVLAFYKYSDFLLLEATSLVARAGGVIPSLLGDWRSPAAPLGISFFTFEFIHYLYEVRVTGRRPIRNPVHFGIFAIFFPCLAAGPIKRFPDFVPQLTTLENPSPAQTWAAVRRIIRGLFKKVCIADLLVEYIRVLEALPDLAASAVALLAVLQGFRIYYDFAGYTDMAIGLAQLMNLRVPENFDRPYFSTSLRDFWRRWHMSLTSWIRDYIYIPMGGNRAHRALNLFVALVLCGLWHGAAWHFAAWGVWHGAGLAIEAGVRSRWPWVFGPGIGRRLLGWVVCYSYVTYGWLLFFYPVWRVLEMTRDALP